MGFYIRKSLKAGPLRFNLSKSGIGVSTGIKGFRIGTGPRGNYVHIGRKGLYYRKTTPSSINRSSKSRISQKQQSPAKQIPAEHLSVEMKKIESINILKLQDSSSDDLLFEINKKN
jgi:hypothetical protein